MPHGTRPQSQALPVHKPSGDTIVEDGGGRGGVALVTLFLLGVLGIDAVGLLAGRQRRRVELAVRWLGHVVNGVRHQCV